MARPRSEEANRAALDATVGILVDLGLEGVTWQEVAERSGVARSTLHRHFASREDLVEAAVRSCHVDYLTPDTGSLEEDLRFLFDHRDSSPEERQLEDLLPIVLDAARRDPTFVEVVDDIIENRRRPLLTVLRLAQLRGELDPELELDDVFSLIIGPLMFKRVVLQTPVTDEYKDLVIDWVLGALNAHRQPIG